MQNSLVNDGRDFSEEALSELANSWEEAVNKGVLKITRDPSVMTEVLDDLLNEFAGDKLHLDSSKNPMGYIYIAAKSRAINKVTPKFRRYEVSESEVENIEKYSDEMGRSPAERVFWESRRQILEDAFEELAQVFKDNGHIRDPHKAAQILKGFLEGKSCQELAEEFHLTDKNYPSVLKTRYLPTLKWIIRKLEKPRSGIRHLAA